MDIAVLITALILNAALTIGLLVERHYYSRQTNETINKLTKSLISRNPGDYAAYMNAEQPSKETKQREPDEVPIAELTDDEFDTFIAKQNN